MACAGELFGAIPAGRRGREILTRQILQCVDGRVPVIVTTSHFSSTVCVERSPPRTWAPPCDGHAALSWRDVPGRRSADPRFLRDPVRCAAHSHHDPGCARGGHRCRPPSWRAWPAKSSRCRISRWKRRRGGETARAHPAGRRGHRRPWDGEEGITLLADLDAGATGSMTGGGYADGIRPIIDAHRAGTGPGLCAVPGLASPDQP